VIPYFKVVFSFGFVFCVRLSFGLVFVVRVCAGVGSGRWNHDGEIFLLVIISHCNPNPVFGLCNKDISM
jgi:hypothetical protein